MTPWLDRFIGKGDEQAMLIGIAGVAVVVWTAGFVVRSLGHRPNSGLIAAMNYAQLSFMGGLVAAFLTPLALQVVALVFLLQEFYQIPRAFYTRSKRAEQRTFGDQQYIETLGIETRAGMAGYVALETPYIIGIVLIVIRPSQFLAIPLLWIALYLSYQIMIFFLFSPRDGEVSNATRAPSTIPMATSATNEPMSLAILKTIQRQLTSSFNTPDLVQRVFAGDLNRLSTARMLLQQMDDEANSMSVCYLAQNGISPILGSAYIRAVIQHRLATVRLFLIVTKLPPENTSTGVLEDVMAAEQNGSPLVQYSIDASGTLNLNRLSLETFTTHSLPVYLLAETYIEETNGVLMRLDGLLAKMPGESVGL